MATSLPDSIQQSYMAQSNAALNSQIQVQLYATYAYLSMAFFCDREDVALENFALFFLTQSQKWMERTETLFLLLGEREGFLTIGRIADEGRHDWLDGFMAMECAFHLEKTLNQSLLQLYELANSNGDIYLCKLLKSHFLNRQVEIIKEIGGYLTNLRQLGAPENHLAEFIFDKLTLAEATKEK